MKAHPKHLIQLELDYPGHRFLYQPCSKSKTYHDYFLDHIYMEGRLIVDPAYMCNKRRNYEPLVLVMGEE